MLTMASQLLCTRTSGARRSRAIVGGLAAVAATLISLSSSAQAWSGIGSGDCLFTQWGVSCTHAWRRGFSDPHIISVPAARSEEEIADFNLRDRLWRTRCKPVVKQDADGIARYSYSAPGCDYGRYE
jgi:hypothetical protein